jgi:LAGLIDADG DNA endonuclease family
MECITRIQQEILLGSCLGDAHLEKNGNSHRVRFDHSIKQREWILWKWERLKPYVQKIVEYSVFDKRIGKWYRKIRFSTCTSLSGNTSYAHRSVCTLQRLHIFNVQPFIFPRSVLTPTSLDVYSMCNRLSVPRRGSTSSMCNRFAETHLRCATTLWKGTSKMCSLKGTCNRLSVAHRRCATRRGSTS